MAGFEDFFSALGGGNELANTTMPRDPVVAAPIGMKTGSDDRLGLGRQIYDYFLERGMTPERAAALAGNMVWEGGGKTNLVNPGDNIRNSPRSPHSVGIGQWNDRAPSLIAFSRAQGIDIPEGSTADANYMRAAINKIPLKTQLDFAWTELNGPESRARTMLENSGDLRSAVGGAISYHRPAGWTSSNPYGGHGFDNRLSLANNILADASTRGRSQPADGMDATGYASKPMQQAASLMGGAKTGDATPAQMPGTPPIAGLSEPSPMGGLFAQDTGNDAITRSVQLAMKQAESRQEAANEQAASDAILKVPMRQPNIQSILQLLQKRAAAGTLGTTGV